MINKLLMAACVLAQVTSVLDGDTFKAKAEVWPQLHVQTSVRVHHIDTPEKGWRASCEAERKLGKQATAYAKRQLEGQQVLLCDVQLGKYAGRVLADVYLDGESYSDLILDKQLATAYEGGTKPSWCKKEAL